LVGRTKKFFEVSTGVCCDFETFAFMVA